MATLSLDPEQALSPPAAAETGAARDAANYAFIDLSKRFRRYRAGFEGG